MAQFLSMPERRAARKLGFAEVFARKQAGADDKLGRGDLFAPFPYDAEQTQIGCATATNHRCIPFDEQGSGNAGLVLLGALLAHVTRRRFAPNVASLAAERRVSARPGREAADAIEDFPGRLGPVDAAVFLFEQRGAGGRFLGLRAR